MCGKKANEPYPLVNFSLTGNVWRDIMPFVPGYGLLAQLVGPDGKPIATIVSIETVEPKQIALPMR